MTLRVSRGLGAHSRSGKARTLGSIYSTTKRKRKERGRWKKGERERGRDWGTEERRKGRKNRGGKWRDRGKDEGREAIKSIDFRNAHWLATIVFHQAQKESPMNFCKASINKNKDYLKHHNKF